MRADHTLNTHTLPTRWGGSVDESQDSGGSGNFLSPGVGQGRASPNSSAPLAASARASQGRRAPYKGGRALGPHALRVWDRGYRLPAPQARAARAPRSRQGGRNRRGPAAAASGPRSLARPPPDSARNEWGRVRVWRPRRKPLRAEAAAAPGAPARGAASRLPFPPDPARRPPDRGRPRRPTAARSPQLLAVRPRNSPVVGL